MRRHLQGLLGASILLAIVGAAALAPVVAPADPLAQDLALRLKPPSTGPYLLGSDQLGRDVLSRLMYGARVSLTVGFAGAVIAGTLGFTLGLVAGYRRGRFDTAVVAFADAQLALPFVIAAIAVAAALGPSLINIIGVLVFTGWVIFARVARAEALSLRSREFVEAARAVGATSTRVLARHIVPNVLPAATVIGTLQVARLMLVESALSFLGVGVPPSQPTWGAMLADGRDYVRVAWWVATFPGLAITVTVLGVNFLGSWLREQMNPRRRI